MQLKLDSQKTADAITNQKVNIDRMERSIQRIYKLTRLINDPRNHDYVKEVIEYIKNID